MKPPAVGRGRRGAGGAYLDIHDDLPVFCPECAEREFGTGGAPESEAGDENANDRNVDRIEGRGE